MCIRVPSLGTDIFRNLGHFGSIYKGTLQSGHIVSLCKEHIPPPDQLVGPLCIQNGPRIYFRGDPKGYTCGKVGLYDTRNYIYRWSLGSDYQMDPDCPRQLCQTGYGGFYLLPCSHDQVGKLVDY